MQLSMLMILLIIHDVFRYLLILFFNDSFRHFQKKSSITMTYVQFIIKNENVDRIYIFEIKTNFIRLIIVL